MSSTSKLSLPIPTRWPSSLNSYIDGGMPASPHSDLWLRKSASCQGNQPAALGSRDDEGLPSKEKEQGFLTSPDPAVPWVSWNPNFRSLLCSAGYLWRRGSKKLQCSLLLLTFWTLFIIFSPLWPRPVKVVSDCWLFCFFLMQCWSSPACSLFTKALLLVRHWSCAYVTYACGWMGKGDFRCHRALNWATKRNLKPLVLDRTSGSNG